MIIGCIGNLYFANFYSANHEFLMFISNDDNGRISIPANLIRHSRGNPRFRRRAKGNRKDAKTAEKTV
jgi:hypothetical protein